MPLDLAACGGGTLRKARLAGKAMTARLGYLWLLASLAVTLTRQFFLQSPSSPSITEFLISWFIHFMAVGLFAVFAGVCIMHFGKFWLKGTRAAERQWTMEEVFYAVLMAVLVGTVFAAFAASAAPPDDYSG
jgi:hypothetical protein